MFLANDVITAVDVMDAAGDVRCFGAGKERRIGADIIDGSELMGRRA